jgi:hypothetical protein
MNMIKALKVLVLSVLALSGCHSSQPSGKPIADVINQSLDLAVNQSTRMAESLKDQPDRLPKTVGKTDNWRPATRPGGSADFSLPALVFVRIFQ